MRAYAAVLCVLFNSILTSDAVCSSEYGPNPVCRYVPAPPGKTPACARPGLTYCEHPDHYPSDLIYHLIQKWQFNHKNLIINEQKDEFNALFYPPPSTVYGPPSVPDVGGDLGYHYPEPVYIPKPTQIFPEQGGYYIPPKVYEQPQLVQSNYSVALNGYSDPNYNKDGTFLTYKYSSGTTPQVTKDTQYNTAYQTPTFLTPQTYSHVNGIWKRSQRVKRSIRRRRYLQYRDGDYQVNNGTSLVRRKRQSTITGQPLCRSRSSYIMPRAALNSKGNWMYVVNMPESNQQYTQLVKSEVCSDTNCNGLCQLPQGYSSKCEQKYVQKRLIALEGTGNDLYSDTFWFPSCCICTISNS